MSAAITQPLKWHGGKNYLAAKIIGLMPPRCKNPNDPAPKDPGWLHYVEPYAGGLAVLLANNPRGISEVVNDKNGELTNFWDVLKSPACCRSLWNRLQATPFSSVEFDRAMKHGREVFNGRLAGDSVERAAEFFVRCRQSLAGRMNGFAGISKNRTRRGMNEQASAWINAIEGLPAIHARLQRVLILHGEALDVIRQQDGPRTLFYLDPPYLHETRATTGEFGEHEMTPEQHGELLELLSKIKGRFLLSGYRSKMYDAAAKRRGWRRYDFTVPNQAAGGKKKRRMTECVWTNFRGRR
jgi:DNA adenine methylase